MSTLDGQEACCSLTTLATYQATICSRQQERRTPAQQTKNTHSTQHSFPFSAQESAAPSCAHARLQVGGEADIHARVVRRQLHQAVAVEALVRRALAHQPARGAAPEEQARLALPPGQALWRARPARVRLQAQALGAGVGFRDPLFSCCPRKQLSPAPG